MDDIITKLTSSYKNDMDIEETKKRKYIIISRFIIEWVKMVLFVATAGNMSG